jgi:hypothetical protein
MVSNSNQNVSINHPATPSGGPRLGPLTGTSTTSSSPTLPSSLKTSSKASAATYFSQPYPNLCPNCIGIFQNTRSKKVMEGCDKRDNSTVSINEINFEFAMFSHLMFLLVVAAENVWCDIFQPDTMPTTTSQPARRFGLICY